MKKNNEAYLTAINVKETEPSFVSLRRYATLNHVPIIQYEGILFLKQLIKLSLAKNILEIGTAIGYSAMHMASVDPSIKVTTIERDPAMIAFAKTTFSNSPYHDQITLIEGDALRVTLDPEASFDLIFIDAAKAQSQKFFERYEPYLSNKGIVVTDNLLFHGHVSNPPSSKRLSTLAKKIDAYNHYLISKKDYHTVIYDIGDGMSVSIKNEVNHETSRNLKSN
jgi:predicted O-methyltransferase YrrM